MQHTHPQVFSISLCLLVTKVFAVGFWFLPPNLCTFNHDNATESYEFKAIQMNFGFLTTANMVTLVLHDTVSLYKMRNVKVKSFNMCRPAVGSLAI